MKPPSLDADVVVLGSGVAGLSAALELARLPAPPRVILATRGELGGQGASPLAQGGVAAAIAAGDSPELHAQDTLDAGAGLARSEAVGILTREAPERILDLIRIGAQFDRSADGSLALGLEGAHSRNRILHSNGDRTGAEVTRTLRDSILDTPTIQVLEGFTAQDLVSDGMRVRGVIGRTAEGTPLLIRARAVLLATGGPGFAYLHTTAPPALQGDGLAMAARAGAELLDLEFVQFHPTALAVGTDPLPLLSEALRGAGARLVRRGGDPLFPPDSGGDLQSRDRVSRELWSSLRRGEAVFLDCRGALAEGLAMTFPGAWGLCRAFGFDPRTELLPVTPAVHYHMGGISVDTDGRSSLPGLWAAGEASASGLHGANRLASNSLLEGLVFGPRAARAMALEVAAHPQGGEGIELPLPEGMEVTPPLPDEIVLRVRTLLWERVGVVRDRAELQSAIDELTTLDRALAGEPPSRRNLLLVARLIAAAALAREESLGSHYRADFPESPTSPPQHSVTTLDPAHAMGIRVRHRA